MASLLTKTVLLNRLSESSKVVDAWSGAQLGGGRGVLFRLASRKILDDAFLS